MIAGVERRERSGFGIFVNEGYVHFTQFVGRNAKRIEALHEISGFGSKESFLAHCQNLFAGFCFDEKSYASTVEYQLALRQEVVGPHHGVGIYLDRRSILAHRWDALAFWVYTGHYVVHDFVGNLEIDWFYFLEIHIKRQESGYKIRRGGR